MSVIDSGEAACQKTVGYLDSYLGNELPVETNHAVLRHLESCPRCAAELATRSRVRASLRAAVRATSVPAGLEARVRRAVRAQRSRARAGWFTVATAAIVVICFAIVNLKRSHSPEEAILNTASGRLAAVLNVGLRDHLHCAVFRKYSRQPEAAAQMAEQLGPRFAELLPLVKAKLPADFRILEGHRCTAGGRREYVHFIVDAAGKLLSVVLTAKRPGERLGDGIYQEGVDRFQVVGFESHGYLAYVISDFDAQRNLQLAAAMAPALREYLAGHAG